MDVRSPSRSILLLLLLRDSRASQLLFEQRVARMLNPQILTGSELTVTAKVNKQSNFLFQNDCLSKISLPPQKVNSKPLTLKSNRKK